MSRRHHYKSKDEQVELDITTFLNLMVVLIPFLLITAVFSRITIQELNLPTQAAGGATPDKPLVTIEIILRKDKLEITDGKSITATIPKQGDKYDIATLSKHLQGLKANYPKKEDATLLVESDIEYEDVIRIMDAVKIAEIQQPGQEQAEKKVLFPQLSMGDAP